MSNIRSGSNNLRYFSNTFDKVENLHRSFYRFMKMNTYIDGYRIRTDYAIQRNTW